MPTESIRRQSAPKRASYYELLRHPLWQEKRLRIMGRANFHCERCSTNQITLNVHHKLYRKGAAPWEYADHELQCLCENCHESTHDLKDRLNAALARLHPWALEEVVGHIEAMVACDVVQQYVDCTGDGSLKSGWENVEFPISSDMHAAGFLEYLASPGDGPLLVHIRQIAAVGRVTFDQVINPSWIRGKCG